MKYTFLNRLAARETSRLTFGYSRVLRASRTRKPGAVFVWIPKAAGTSVYQWLEDAINMVKFINPHELPRFPNFGRVTFGHVHYGALRANGTVSKEFDEQAYKFCIVRNPYARAFSLYSYLSTPPISLFEGNFLEFLSCIRIGREPIGLYNSKGLSMTNPQSDWIFDEEGHRLVDEIFSMTDLSRLESCIRARFAVPKDAPLQHLNKSTKNTSLNRALLEHDEIVPMIDEIYARDFLEFGFQTGVAEESRAE